MAKRPWDLLVTEREPFRFYQAALIRVDNGQCVALNKEIGREVIPVAGIVALVLGPGTSITHEASIMLALNDCFVFMCRADSYMHSVWHTGRWQAPELSVKQCVMHADPDQRLNQAKQFVALRIGNELGSPNEIDKLLQATSIEQLLGYEASWAKSMYRLESAKQNLSFRRDFKGQDFVNMRLNLLNNALYSFVTAILISVGLNPSVGFLHGQSRRGGLAFDIADIFKYRLTLKPSFRIPKGVTSKEVIAGLSRDLKRDNQKIIKLIVSMAKDLPEGDLTYEKYRGC